MSRTSWQKIAEGDVRGWIMPFDEEIGRLRRNGLSLGNIAKQIGKGRSYVQQRLMRIAARETDEI